MVTHLIHGINDEQQTGLTLCCRVNPLELPTTDRITWLPDIVTCSNGHTETDSLDAELTRWKAVRSPSVALDIMERMLAELRRLGATTDRGRQSTVEAAAPAVPDERINP